MLAGRAGGDEDGHGGAGNEGRCGGWARFANCLAQVTPSTKANLAERPRLLGNHEGEGGPAENPAIGEIGELGIFGAMHPVFLAANTSEHEWLATAHLDRENRILAAHRLRDLAATFVEGLVGFGIRELAGCPFRKSLRACTACEGNALLKEFHYC